MMMGSFWYCYQILKGVVSPPPATFIILSFTFPFGFYMYAQSPHWSFATNIGLTSAVLSVWTVGSVLITKLLLQKKLHLEVNVFQRWVIFIALVVLIFWFVTKDQLTSYVILQVSALLSYIPVYKNLYKADKNKDSLVFWSTLFLSTCVAAYAAYEKNDMQSWIYIGRAVPSSLGVVILMLKIDLRNKALRSLQ